MAKSPQFIEFISKSAGAEPPAKILEKFAVGPLIFIKIFQICGVELGVRPNRSRSGRVRVRVRVRVLGLGLARVGVRVRVGLGVNLVLLCLYMPALHRVLR